MSRRNPLVFPAVSAKHTATVIFMHGLGDSGNGWSFAVENWRRRSKLDEVKFILPHAPEIALTMNNGYRMPGWYDIVSPVSATFSTFGPPYQAYLDARRAADEERQGGANLTDKVSIGGSVDSIRRNEDEKGIVESRDYIQSLVQKEVDSGIPSERVVLGGFSQGGAISIFTGITNALKIGGIIGMSTYLPLSFKLESTYLAQPVSSAANAQTPILMCHGNADQVVPFELGKMSRDHLRQLGFGVEFKEYAGMPHTAFPEELDDVEAYLAKVLPPVAEEGKTEL